MRYTPPKFLIKFDPGRIADSLWIDYDQAEKEFKDGRVVSRFSEYWTAKLYGFKKSANSNTAGYDGTIQLPLIGVIYVGVRSLTKSGIKFQQSRFIGSGRKCDLYNLGDSIRCIDYEIVVDIVDFPIVLLSVVSSAKLLELIKESLLTPSGLTRVEYYRRVFNTTFDEMVAKTVDPYAVD